MNRSGLAATSDVAFTTEARRTRRFHGGIYFFDLSALVRLRLFGADYPQDGAGADAGVLDS
ncbi:MAG: hypothetical protein R3F14_46705, partial [Polyangiaceae bacterium]